jgi:hypothetical protein
MKPATKKRIETLPVTVLNESRRPAPAKPDAIMQYFAYDHLPEPLQAVSKPFGQLARKIVRELPRNPERTVALRKLLEAKDAAVRAFITVE